jgi:hypothetical protein
MFLTQAGNYTKVSFIIVIALRFCRFLQKNEIITPDNQTIYRL